MVGICGFEGFDIRIRLKVGFIFIGPDSFGWAKKLIRLSLKPRSKELRLESKLLNRGLNCSKWGKDKIARNQVTLNILKNEGGAYLFLNLLYFCSELLLAGLKGILRLKFLKFSRR